MNFESLLDNFCNCSTASLGVLEEKIQIQIRAVVAHVLWH